MRRRAVHAGSLTSLLDVLFIIVFASLVQSTARGEERRESESAAIAAPAMPGPPPTFAALRQAAVAAAVQHVETAPLVVVRVAADGTLAELEWAGERRAVGVPLLERVVDRDVGVAYLGDRAPALRVCGVVARELRSVELAGYVVVIAPASALVELSVALVAGLRRDLTRCQTEQRAMAVIVEPQAIAPAAPRPVVPAPPAGGGS